jgi:S1-C subfamily serine protease
VTIKGVQIPCSHIYAHTRLDAAVLIIETAESLTGALIDFSPLSPLKEVYTGGYQMGFELLITEGILNYSIAKDLGQVPKELWLCTAPTFPGNSGGGVFDRETKKLIGLSVAVGSRPKSYDHVIVPHIHIFIPINVLGEWLSEVEHERQKT